jgi:hypothetical protein
MQYKFGIFAILTALSATAVNAVKQAVGQPQGNPIHTPGLNHIVEAGKAYDITWTVRLIPLLIIIIPDSRRSNYMAP